jgi:thioredoxin reductase (NADPH)
VDALLSNYGQLSEIYPHKPIYDIPVFLKLKPVQQLVDNLMEQIKPFDPGFTLGERVEKLLERQEDNSFIISTSDTNHIHCKVVVSVAWAVLNPVNLDIENLELLKAKGVGVTW